MRNTTEPKNIPPAVAQGCLLLGPPQAVTQFLGESEFQRQWLTRHCSPPRWVHWDHPTYAGVAGLIGACFPQRARGLPGCPTSRLQTELADSLTQGGTGHVIRDPGKELPPPIQAIREGPQRGES